MKGKNNGFIAIIGLLIVVFGIFAVMNYTSKDNSSGETKLMNSSSAVAGEGSEAAEASAAALSLAVTELCDCFQPILKLRADIEADPRLEYELSSKIKKAEIRLRSCYTKAKQKHKGFGEVLFTDFSEACPDAQEEL